MALLQQDPRRLRTRLGSPFAGKPGNEQRGAGGGQQPTDYSEESRRGRLGRYFGGGNADATNAAEDLTRHTGNAWLASQEADTAVLRGSRALLTEGLRLRDVEDDRFARASERLTRSVDRLPQTFSDADYEEFLRNEFAAGATEAAERSLDDFGAARSRLGSAGITGGGVAAGLAQQAELRRMRDTRSTYARAKVDLKKAKMDADAADALRDLEAEFNLAQFNNQSPSLLGLDSLTNQTELDLTRLGLFLGREASDQLARAGKKAGDKAFLGGILQGGLGILGGLFS